MDRKLVCVAAVALALQIIGAARVMCPNDPNCVCGGTLAVELNCNIDGRTVKINLLPNTYINIKCENATSLDYSKLPKCANRMNTFKSVSFKDCPLPSSSFKEVLTNMGVSKTMALIFQNAKKLSGYFDRKHFSGLQDLTKLLLSINGVSHLPDNLFTDINKLTWLNIRSNTINLSEELFKPLERLETLEISHNHMTNISSNLFSHLSYLRKLSLWQSNVTWFSKDLFNGVDVLEELDLSSNGLNELPSSIFKPLRKLKKLTLFSNKFSALPQNLFKHNEELETVVILNNDAKLVELPKYLFGGMAELKQIYIQRSGLEKLPYDVFANSPQITNISLAYNDLETLPESIFNDQINLLELDLSYNKLNDLEPKLFSSLVRLESLNLNHNLLTKICGSTFSALLSLIYLNMENNNLKIISSHLFSNNKQRMSISLAYNKLSFEEKEMRNNSWVVKRISPFAQTYNLRLLNLSHNAFKATFEDWWFNGHENLDISNNFIQDLWQQEASNGSVRDLVKKSIKQAWIAGNPMKCECPNYKFIDFLQAACKAKIKDLRQISCQYWTRQACYIDIPSLVLIMMMLFVNIIAFIVFLVHRKNFCGLFKKKLYTINGIKTDICDYYDKSSVTKSSDKSSASIYYDKKGNITMVIQFDTRDIVLVDALLIPDLVRYAKFKTGYSPEEAATTPTKRDNLLSCFKDCLFPPRFIVITIFSPNFLMSHYSHIDIKKIQSKMTRQSDSIFIFLDVGPENSVYAFLKDQRDPRNSVVWAESNFWAKLSEIVDLKNIAALHDRSTEIIRVERLGDQEYIMKAKVEPEGFTSFRQLSPLEKKVYGASVYKV